MTEDPERGADSQVARVDSSDISSESAPDARRRAFTVIVGLILVGILLNSMLWYISRPEQRGLVRHEDVKLSTLVVTEQRTLRLRYGFETHLHDLVREGVITVPNIEAVDLVTVENLSQVTVVVADYDERITQDRIDGLSSGFEIVGLGSVGQTGEDVAYRFLMRDDSIAQSVTYFVATDQVVVIDDRLLE